MLYGSQTAIVGENRLGRILASSLKYAGVFDGVPAVLNMAKMLYGCGIKLKFEAAMGCVI